jgi:hypothetical protein
MSAAPSFGAKQDDYRRPLLPTPSSLDGSNGINENGFIGGNGEGDQHPVVFQDGVRKRDHSSTLVWVTVCNSSPLSIRHPLHSIHSFIIMLNVSHNSGVNFKL